jgi:ribosomal protein S18 acetylase RimI-like enzyme
MMFESFQIKIRNYEPGDRASIRRICYETSFLQKPYLFFDDPEIVTDALTRYYLECEPQSCFVAESKGRVVGYIIGTLDMARMNYVYGAKILMPLTLKAVQHHAFFRPKTMRFIWNYIKSVLKGEFLVPNFTRDYPATFHINVDQEQRGKKVGSQLIARALQLLKEKNVPGVQFSTMTDEAKDFFLRQGFQILYSSRRSFLHYALGHDTAFHLLGKRLIS